MKSFCRVLKAVVVGAALAGLIGCGGSKDGDRADASGYPRAKTLYLGGSQWGDPSTFNPLAAPWQAAWPVGDRFNLMYEPLLAYNSLNGEFESLLGTLISRDNDKVVVKINPAAKWSDGEKVTAKDVKFIFDLGRNHPGAETAYVLDFIAEITVSQDEEDGAELLTFHVNKARNNPLVVLDHLLAVRIVPAHVFEKLLADNGNDLGAVKNLKIDQNPVVSGPYNLENYNNERIVLKRRDDYWGAEALYSGKLPNPEYIIHPIYKNNDHFAIALQQGRLDASQTFIPRIWLQKNNGVGTWHDDAPYFVPGTMPLLIINTTKSPLDDKNFRRAMAAAIPYDDIRELAVSRYAPDMKAGLIMDHGLEKQFYSEEDVAAHGVGYDLEKAKKILADAGYKSVFKGDGTLEHMEDKAGNKLPTLYITVPAGWSDWEAMVKIVEKGLRAAGIDAREKPVDGSLYWPARPSGGFDILIAKVAENITPSLPWSRFEALMSSRNWAPADGSSQMHENYGRYNNPKAADYNKRVDELLRSIPMMENDEERVAAYRELNVIFMQDQPAIPLCYLPEQFYQFSSKVWKNWPTSANPYAPPLLPWIGASTKVLWQLEPAR